MRALVVVMAGLGYVWLELWTILIGLDLYYNPENYFPVQDFMISWAIIVAGFAWGIGTLLLAARMHSARSARSA